MNHIEKIIFKPYTISFLLLLLPPPHTQKKSIHTYLLTYLSCGKLFGAGVILATGFIHMFPSADQVGKSYLCMYVWK